MFRIAVDVELVLSPACMVQSCRGGGRNAGLLEQTLVLLHLYAVLDSKLRSRSGREGKQDRSGP